MFLTLDLLDDVVDVDDVDDDDDRLPATIRIQCTKKPYNSRFWRWLANVSFSLFSISSDVDLISALKATQWMMHVSFIVLNNIQYLHNVPDKMISNSLAAIRGLTCWKFLKERVSATSAENRSIALAYFIKLRILSNTRGSVMLSDETSILSVISLLKRASRFQWKRSCHRETVTNHSDILSIQDRFFLEWWLRWECCKLTGPLEDVVTRRATRMGCSWIRENRKGNKKRQWQQLWTWKRDAAYPRALSKMKHQLNAIYAILSHITGVMIISYPKPLLLTAI